MSNLIEAVQRSGIWPKWPKIKAYIKHCEQFMQLNESEKLLLERYANGELVQVATGPLMLDYDFPMCASSMSCISQDMLHKALVQSLLGDASWQTNWRRAVAYKTWSHRMKYRWHIRAQDEFKRGLRRQKLAMLPFTDLVFAASACLNLGWTELGLDLARRCLDAIDQEFFIDASDAFGQRRAQYFILRLISDWKQWPERNWPVCANDEPIYSMLLANWREPDAERLVPLLLAACDRHTQHSRPDSSKGFWDFGHSEHYYVPFELLLLFRLRAMEGLDNPLMDHPLMQTPLGQLPLPTPVYSDDLLEAVLKRARTEIADF